MRAWQFALTPVEDIYESEVRGFVSSAVVFFARFTCQSFCVFVLLLPCLLLSTCLSSTFEIPPRNLIPKRVCCCIHVSRYPWPRSRQEPSLLCFADSYLPRAAVAHTNK
ncbi:hypothetical protein K443DRAFT_678955 [Laccaria amethystina LaAM-08-1]|uniref:Unplaced genomic scaffold K443scaffold_84, whole genome shotgun sequence n=1 Tax=Laccaria amethystina LaAM-08-1 TaxID=1095629 RepID=A0A0C9X6S0_9AGAR|nr:hypothetical protein K443DRAFT_678955 [Laccaria amethystina LaAM-08-1]